MAEVTAHAFDRDVSDAILAASQGYAITTGRGETSHVLLPTEDYRRLLADERSIIDGCSDDDDLDLEPGRVEVDLRALEL